MSNPSDTDRSAASEPHPASNHKALVGVVVFLGVLIVLGLGGLVYGLMTRTGKSEMAEAPAVVSEVTAPLQPASAPVGTRVIDMTAADGVLYVHLLDEQGRERIRAYDAGGGLVFDIDPVSGATE